MPACFKIFTHIKIQYKQSGILWGKKERKKEKTVENKPFFPQRCWEKMELSGDFRTENQN